MKDKMRIKGKLTVTVFGKDGKVKRHPRTFIERLFGMQGKPMVSVNHNIVTDEGDALIADLMAETPARQKVNNANGFIPVGTGWTGTSPKTNTFVNAISGSAKALSATYPKLKGSWGAANDNVVQYRALYVAGDLAATINEAAIMNAATAAGDCLAYAQVTPSAVVTASDSLQVDWEITLLGA
jgi:hypothetical protein